MHIDSGHRQIRFTQLLFVALLLAASATVPIAAAASVLPANAHGSSYAGGWECSRGYRRANEACVVIDVPTNAYLNYSGFDWQCDRGYLKVDQGCNLVRIPADAHADDDQFGRGWQCDHGYREAHGACGRVVVPVNAYPVASSYSRGWECDRGFSQHKLKCLALVVPTHGYLDYSGNESTCAEGFLKQADACVADSVTHP